MQQITKVKIERHQLTLKRLENQLGFDVSGVRQFSNVSSGIRPVISQRVLTDCWSLFHSDLLLYAC